MEQVPLSAAPTIIEAARALYSRHSVEDISRHDAGARNLRVTSQRIDELIEEARNTRTKTIVFVTGVPGAGKTLVGLNVATKKYEKGQDTHAVFLSGNGPLVAILREALTRDAVKRLGDKAKRKERSDVKQEGLSATVTRKDGHHPIIFMQCGSVRHRVDAKAEAAARPFEHTVIVRPTAYQAGSTTGTDKRIEFQSLYQLLVDDETRNRAICEEVVQAVRDGRSPLILTERNEHLDRFESVLSAIVPHVVVLRGGRGKKQRRTEAERLAAIPREEGRVILATGKYIGEGFGDPRLDTLFLTLPVSWRGTIAQYVGRLHRLYEGKREVRVYDYADVNVSMLARMFDRRCRRWLHDCPSSERNSGLARRRDVACRSIVETRLRGQRPPAHPRRG